MRERSHTRLRTAGKTLVALLVAAAAALVSGATNAGSGTDADARSGEAKTAGKRTVVKLMETRYGPILVSGKGRALYLFKKDGRGPSQCYDECATAWPPYIATGKLEAGKGARGKLLGTVQRTDGTRQVTYAGKPLYFYIHDRKPGQVLCHDVFEFGGKWLVVKRSGKPVS